MAEPAATKANLVALADAVVAALNAAVAGTFAEAFTAARRFAPLVDLADLDAADEPLVLVQPIDDDERREAKGSTAAWRGDYEVAVIIYARVGAGDAAETRTAELLLLRQQIRDFFKGEALAVTGTVATRAQLTDILGTPAYADDLLIEQNCFGSATGLRFTVLT